MYHFQLRKLRPDKKTYQEFKERLEGDTWIHFNSIPFLINFYSQLLTEEKLEIMFFCNFPESLFVPSPYILVTFI